MHILLLIVGIALIGFLLWLNFGGNSFPATGGKIDKDAQNTDGIFVLLSREKRREVNAALRQKGKAPWLERNKGVGVVDMGRGKLLTESLDCLDSYEARTTFDIRDEKPLFTEDYKNQTGKADDLSRALEQHLRKRLPFPFKALAGEGRVDVVTLADYGNKAYAFIVSKAPGEFIREIHGYRLFYYDVPRVFLALEEFVKAHPEMDEVLWLERDTGFFMFVVQQKL